MILRERYDDIQELIDLFGEEYLDYILVFCSPDGRPMESQIITRALQKLIKENNLPHIVFHSLQHSSVTYKLKLNSGDVKSVQGDSRHLQVKMTTDVYLHIIDEDRKYNAAKFEKVFYAKYKNSHSENLKNEQAPPQELTVDKIDNESEMLLKLIQNPEIKELVSTL